MPNNDAYTLMSYTNFNGSSAVTAVHILDMADFLTDHPDAEVFRR
jgi:hypothetical protein